VVLLPAVVPASKPMSYGVELVHWTAIVVVASFGVTPPEPPSTPSDPKAKVAVLLITHSAMIVSETPKVDVWGEVALAGPTIHANPVSTPSPVTILMLRPHCDGRH
jgi:hypothetical protein